MTGHRIVTLIAATLLVMQTYAQPLLQESDSLASLPSVPGRYVEQVNKTATSLDSRLGEKSTKLIAAWQKQEARIFKKLSRKDSVKAATMLATANRQWKQLDEKLQREGSLQTYIPSLDTLASSISFLQQHPNLLDNTGEGSKKLKEASEALAALQQRFQKAEEIKKFLQARKQMLKDQLANLGFAKELKKLNKQAYYYSEQLKEYKALLKDHHKVERKALELLSDTKPFREFMRRNSQLASLFRIPGPNSTNTQALAGLQTRAQVNGIIQQQVAAGGPGAQQQFQQNLQQAQSQLSDLKSKLNRLGGGSSDDIMPDGFKPNHQRTKRFLDRIEYGVNMQSQKANGYFPVTSDIGLSIGYKLNDRSILGIGASYKMGWGESIQDIKITHQGIGLRSFVDWKIKGSFWLSGGFEMNYRSEFQHVEELKDLDAWQQSGLIGISKQVSVRSKFLKKTKLQLLWDFLSYQQVPRTQAVLFRIGYTF